MWSVIKASRWYVLLTVVLFFLFVLANFPAHYAWNLIKENTANLPLNVSSLSGSVWNASGMVDYQDLSMHIDWDLNPLSLVLLSPELSVRVQSGKDADLHGVITVSQKQITISQLNGTLSVPMINPYLKSQKVSGGGSISVFDLGLVFDHENKIFELAEGRLLWKEAKASYPGRKGIENIELPDIVGKLTNDEKGITLNVKSGKDGSALASAFLMNKGWGGVKVRKRSVDLVGQTWVGNQQPDDIIFQVREKLW